MGEGKRRERAVRSRAVPYPAPKSDRCQRTMVAVIKALGNLPANDDGIEDRALACLFVAWGELATMQDYKRRDRIVGSLVERGMSAIKQVLAMAEQAEVGATVRGLSVVEMLEEAVEEGTAESVPLPDEATDH